MVNILLNSTTDEINQMQIGYYENLLNLAVELLEIVHPNWKYDYTRNEYKYAELILWVKQFRLINNAEIQLKRAKLINSLSEEDLQLLGLVGRSTHSAYNALTEIVKNSEQTND
jgi:hypothetical protein